MVVGMHGVAPEEFLGRPALESGKLLLVPGRSFGVLSLRDRSVFVLGWRGFPEAVILTSSQSSHSATLTCVKPKFLELSLSIQPASSFEAVSW